MNILVIFTGGTIGSCLKDGWISTDATTKYMLLDRYKGGKDVFDTVEPYSILSENLSASEINCLQKEIAKYVDSDYDGIIVTHGTDTLHYTSCAIEYAFADSRLPIVFVSADYPLENEKSNGYKNFEAAVEFIRSGAGAGVFVSYKNDNREETDIHIPSRILSHAECSGNVYSIDGSTFASYNGELVLKGEKTDKECCPIGITEYSAESGILCIESYPGNNYGYSLAGIKAVILRPYHSSTLNTANKGFADFCARASELEIPVFLVNADGKKNYESLKALDELEIQVLPYGTFVSAYMKIWAGISSADDASKFL